MAVWIAVRERDYHDLGKGTKVGVERQVVLRPVVADGNSWTVLGGNRCRVYTLVYYVRASGTTETNPARYNYGCLLNTLAILGYIACASVLVLLLQFTLQKLYSKSNAEKISESAEADFDDVIEASDMAASPQPVDTSIQIFNAVRLAGCLVLLGMAICTAYATGWGDMTEKLQPNVVWLHLALCVTFTYSSLLTLHSILAAPSTIGTTTRHLAIVLASAWLGYIYRDAWPLATVLLTPVDAAEGTLLWAKLAMLTLVAVIVPLLIPRRYVPLDPRV
ncbi:uncharacterized protein FIBRA_06059 [Fibroporia radiculosa]|uniref:Uncharacterized protein n=1 Tax=Fibroporia radiculosa TaxID=599839 RepID=J4GAL2_9APHY|nr:uncharacterized protein FIBRA_06059 [Fibroporia radiculosa]CCM03908.1 predicted protein [Fibroporia radiculosa]